MERRAPDVESAVTGSQHLGQIARRPVWTARETAMVLRCHPSTVYRELSRGGMRGVRIGNVWRIPADQFGMLTRSLSLEKGDKCGDSAAHSDVQSPCADRATPPVSSSTPALTNQSNPTASSEFTGPAKSTRPVLQVSLLGRPRTYIDGVRMEDLERSNRRSQVVHLLALHRSGLSVTQLEDLLELGGDSCEEENSGAYYVRNLVYAVRKQVSQKAGWDGIIESSTRRGAGMHHYKLPDNTVCDLWEFEDKLDEADRLMVVASAAQVRRAQSSWARSGTPGTPGAPGAPGAAEQDIARAARERAAVLREDALHLYKGEFCEGFTNVCLVQEAHVLEKRYIHAALQQADYWRAIALEIQGAIGSSLCASTAATPAACLSYPDVRAIMREALRNYERVLRVDSYQEEACIGAMECNAHLGNGRGVGLVFNRHRDNLGADLLQAPGALVLQAYQHCKELVSSKADIH
jgi:excisionase family DNA binding protein